MYTEPYTNKKPTMTHNNRYKALWHHNKVTSQDHFSKEDFTNRKDKDLTKTKGSTTKVREDLLETSSDDHLCNHVHSLHPDTYPKDTQHFRRTTTTGTRRHGKYCTATWLPTTATIPTKRILPTTRTRTRSEPRV